MGRQISFSHLGPVQLQSICPSVHAGSKVLRVPLLPQLQQGVLPETTVHVHKKMASEQSRFSRVKVIGVFHCPPAWENREAQRRYKFLDVAGTIIDKRN